MTAALLWAATRASLKGMIQAANSQLQACKQIHSEANQEDPRIEAGKRTLYVITLKTGQVEFAVTMF
jgi:hypothetical protein